MRIVNKNNRQKKKHNLSRPSGGHTVIDIIYSHTRDTKLKNSNSFIWLILILANFLRNWVSIIRRQFVKEKCQPGFMLIKLILKHIVVCLDYIARLANYMHENLVSPDHLLGNYAVPEFDRFNVKSLEQIVEYSKLRGHPKKDEVFEITVTHSRRG